MEENLFAEKQIRTVSGIYINVFDPNPEHITIEDIAHGLSMQPRWGGHCMWFFSVAQHSRNVALGIPDKYKCNAIQLAALMHDASEAYLMDIPRPIKIHLRDYAEIEHNLMTAIASKFGFEWPLHKIVKESDERELHEEWEHLIIKRNYKDIDTYCMKPALAKSYFLQAFKKYSE